VDSAADCKYFQLFHNVLSNRIYFLQSLEKFSSLTHQVSAELDVFIQAIHDTEFPNNVEATRKLLEDQGVDYARLKVNLRYNLSWA